MAGPASKQPVPADGRPLSGPGPAEDLRGRAVPLKDVGEFTGAKQPPEQWATSPAVMGALVSSSAGEVKEGRAWKPNPSHGYLELPAGDDAALKLASSLWGSVVLVVDMPRDWRDARGSSFVWRPSDSESVGTHIVRVVGYSTRGVDVLSWGSKGQMSWAAFRDPKRVTAVYAELPAGAADRPGLSDYGIDPNKLPAGKAVAGDQPGGDQAGARVGAAATSPAAAREPWHWQWEHTWTVLGASLRVLVEVSTADASADAAKLNWSRIGAAAVLASWYFYREDWVGLVREVERAASEAGLKLNPAKLNAFADALKVSRETAVLDQPGPDQGESSLPSEGKAG